MIKMAMVTIHREQRERGWRTRMLLQVHDELVFDLYREEEEEVIMLDSGILILIGMERTETEVLTLL